MIVDELFQKYDFAVKDISEIDKNKMFLHYTNLNNLSSIAKKGLEPNIGINAKIIEKSKKVFFSIGDKGALVIMDSWIKWLVAKPKSNFIYYIGAYLLKLRFFPKIIHRFIITHNQKNKNKYKWAYKTLNKMLNNSIYLILDLEENIDFSFDDIDEIKSISNIPKDYVANLYAYDSDVNDKKIEYNAINQNLAYNFYDMPTLVNSWLNNNSYREKLLGSQYDEFGAGNSREYYSLVFKDNK